MWFLFVFLFIFCLFFCSFFVYFFVYFLVYSFVYFFVYFLFIFLFIFCLFFCLFFWFFLWFLLCFVFFLGQEDYQCRLLIKWCPYLSSLSQKYNRRLRLSMHMYWISGKWCDKHDMQNWLLVMWALMFYHMHNYHTIFPSENVLQLDQQ